MPPTTKVQTKKTAKVKKLTLAEVFDESNRRSWFRPVDTDAPGGFARAVEVQQLNETDGKAIFKVMRYDVPNPEIARRHFLEELNLLIDIETRREKADPKEIKLLEPITRIYNSGFVPKKLPELLDKYRKPEGDCEIFQTGLNNEEFYQLMEDLDMDEWVPFLVVELADYNDSLFRQIQRRPEFDSNGLFRLPTAEVVFLAIRLLDTMAWLHDNLDRGYIDWKPEHIYWNGRKRRLKLIDWNITWQLDDSPGREQNIRDDVRLFCGAVLYCSLTLLDPEFGVSIGARPTKDIENAVPETRRRYLTENPLFYEADKNLDAHIKEIVRRGLHPVDGYENPAELRTELVEYLKTEFQLTIDIMEAESAEFNNGLEALAYLNAIRELRIAQEKLGVAYGFITDATRFLGKNPELNRLADIIRIAQQRLP